MVNSNVRDRIKQTLIIVNDMLVRGDYAGLADLCGGLHLKANNIQSEIVGYGRKLIYPPNEAYEDVDAIQIQGRFPVQYSIRFPFFTEEEGRSDLELQATFIDSDPNSGIMRIEIDGILVP